MEHNGKSRRVRSDVSLAISTPTAVGLFVDELACGGKNNFHSSSRCPMEQIRESSGVHDRAERDIAYRVGRLLIMLRVGRIHRELLNFGPGSIEGSRSTPSWRMDVLDVTESELQTCNPLVRRWAKKENSPRHCSWIIGSVSPL